MKHIRAIIWSAILLWLVLATFIAWGIKRIRTANTPSHFSQIAAESPSNEKDALDSKDLKTQFAKNSSTFLPPENDAVEWTLVVTGDAMLARSVNAKIASTNDPQFPFEHTRELLKNADITLVNLETPLIKDCALTHEGMHFCGLLENAQGLAYAGVDIASLANNHAKDYGIEGEEKTADQLKKLGITPLHQAKTVYYSFKGITIAFLGFDTVGHSINEGKIIQLVKEAKEKADLVIPFFSWGTEYTAMPNSYQRRLAAACSDAGAALVIGNHPHWVQRIEKFNGVPIIYSHGNFIFDQMWSQETREGVIGTYTFKGTQLVSTEFTPIYINQEYQPQIAEPARAEKILQRMHPITDPL